MAQRILLTADWQLSFTHPATGKKHKIPAVVPGSAYQDIMKAGILPDLYFGKNALLAREWERVDFIYTAIFIKPELKPGQRLEILFEGLDTAATIKLNSRQIAFFDNMFIPHRVDITGSVRKKNILTVEIRNILDYSAKRIAELGIAGFEYAHMGSMEPLYARKAQHMFGWDIAPRLLGGGIWREVFLILHDKSEILPEEIYFYTKQVDEKKMAAQVGLCWALALDPATDWRKYQLIISGACGDSAFKRRFSVYFIRGKYEFHIDNAKLWWPYGYGEANLYDLSLELWYQDEKIDEYKMRSGLRTLELDFHSEPEDPGKNRFHFLCNQVPIFARGSNWVPAETWCHKNEENR